jgi:hypothetical protein
LDGVREVLPHPMQAHRILQLNGIGWGMQQDLFVLCLLFGGKHIVGPVAFDLVAMKPQGSMSFVRTGKGFVFSHPETDGAR